MQPCVFLDRDGVLIEDVDLLTDSRMIHVLPGVAQALDRLRRGDYRLVVITNQTVVARGLATLEQVDAINAEIERRLLNSGAWLDAWYVCPHHPSATVVAHRLDCECRKPRPGMIRRAAVEHGIDLARSYLVGDRLSDVAAGAAAGCRTVQVASGRHDAPPIETTAPHLQSARPDHFCAGLLDAAQWILADAMRQAA
jgi:D-glycero-D-manno-heptose 1,7-bisphosphate phosphatase